MANSNFNDGEWKISMVVVSTEVIWKWQLYENNCIALFPLSPLSSKMFFFNLSANNPVVGSWNQSDI